jgi:hypothetical protein
MAAFTGGSGDAVIGGGSDVLLQLHRVEGR